MIEATQALASDFVVSYPKRGLGKIHAAMCHRPRGLVKPLHMGVLNLGRAPLAPCCVQHEQRVYELYLTAKDAGL